ncbi:putative ABC transporter permease [Treponema sp.]|uniref:putative ABC transporter permease n=1 Tax=Treponema sp. TaxID=166 RepID=UPI0025F9A2AC|nr:putative ABC transporter permease [Treponema sp.]MCR5217527.1 putative ABC transporter permease [Treponema sp.]
MNILLVLAFLFFTGSTAGWILEVFWRRFFSKNNPEKKWLNPGFLTGPYLPLYGLSLIILFSLSFTDVSFIKAPALQKVILFIFMSICITTIEYIAGLIFIKGMKIRLWDYSKNRFNIKGIICPQYSFYWIILSAIYYFLIHPRILSWLYWFTNHLTFSFAVGFFWGVFTLDLCYTFKLSAKIRKFAKEEKIIIKYENLKESFRKKNEELKEKTRFLFPLKSDIKSIRELLHDIFKSQ